MCQKLVKAVVQDFRLCRVDIIGNANQRQLILIRVPDAKSRAWVPIPRLTDTSDIGHQSPPFGVARTFPSL